MLSFRLTLVYSQRKIFLDHHDIENNCHACHVWQRQRRDNNRCYNWFCGGIIVQCSNFHKFSGWCNMWFYLRSYNFQKSDRHCFDLRYCPVDCELNGPKLIHLCHRHSIRLQLDTNLFQYRTQNLLEIHCFDQIWKIQEKIKNCCQRLCVSFESLNNEDYFQFPVHMWITRTGFLSNHQ